MHVSRGWTSNRASPCIRARAEVKAVKEAASDRSLARLLSALPRAPVHPGHAKFPYVAFYPLTSCRVWDAQH
ncbi:hypothetical protein SRHO_G00120220 [Serrasalmus rhombeus]